MTRKRNPLDFERAMADLEQIVARLEDGGMSLEEALRAYERGVDLGRICQRALDAAEQRIQILSAGGDELQPEPFSTGDDDELSDDDRSSDD